MSPARLEGVACAPGRAAGRTWSPRLPPRGPPEQLLARTVDEAIALVAEQLSRAAEDAVVQDAANLDLVHLVEVHQALLIDPLFAGRARRLEAAGRSPAAAVQGAVDQAVGDLRASGDAILAARVGDVEQLGQRLLDALLHRPGGPPPRPPGPVVLVARDLAPDELLVLLGPIGQKVRLLRAVLLERGGPLTHTSVLARQRGIPLVGGLPGIVQRLPEGTPVLVDGGGGTVVVEPDREAMRSFHALAGRRHRPLDLADRPVRVLANLDLPEEASQARRRGADGIGLLRTDAMLGPGGRAPSVAEQVRRYRRALGAWPGERVIIRTFDAPAGDAPEPSLGVRGVRWLRAAPERSKAQLEALLEAARRQPETRLCVLLPMVSRADEVREVREWVRAAWQGDGPPPQVGAMVETPAAALDIDAILDEAELVALGSNDLLSLLVGASREDAAVAPLLDPGHPALWRLVGQVAAAASARGRELVACGALASDPNGLARLVDLGVRTVSVGLADLARVRRILGVRRG